jgi:Ca2+-binding EF-hand superfamily protein
MMRMRHWRRMHQRQAMLHRFDQDGDHHLSEAERADARKAGEAGRARFQEGRKEMLARFDANHDGKLDENERKGVHDAWQDFLKQRPVLAPAPAVPAGK